MATERRTLQEVRDRYEKGVGWPEGKIAQQRTTEADVKFLLGLIDCHDSWRHEGRCDGPIEFLPESTAGRGASDGR